MLLMQMTMPHRGLDWCCRRLAGEDKARVFATDTVLTTLMCAARSVYSWDVVVTRAGMLRAIMCIGSNELAFPCLWSPAAPPDGLQKTQALAFDLDVNPTNSGAAWQRPLVTACYTS